MGRSKPSRIGLITGFLKEMHFECDLEESGWHTQAEETGGCDRSNITGPCRKARRCRHNTDGAAPTSEPRCPWKGGTQSCCGRPRPQGTPRPKLIQCLLSTYLWVDLSSATLNSFLHPLLHPRSINWVNPWNWEPALTGCNHWQGHRASKGPSSFPRAPPPSTVGMSLWSNLEMLRRTSPQGTLGTRHPRLTFGRRSLIKIVILPFPTVEWLLHILQPLSIKYIFFKRLIESNAWQLVWKFCVSHLLTLQPVAIGSRLTLHRLQCKRWARLSYVEANHFWQSLQRDKHSLSTVPLYLKVTTNILLKCKQLTSWLVRQRAANLSKIKTTKILFDTR